MIDIKRLREDLDTTIVELARHGYTLDKARYEALEEKRKTLQTETQDLQHTRNTRSKAIGQAKAKGEDIQPLLEEVANLGELLKAKEHELNTLQTEIESLLLELPNILDSVVPDGKDDTENLEISKTGTPTEPDFEPKDHITLGESLGLLDFECSAKLSGARFVVMKGDLNRLHRSLIQFMLNIHVEEHGYTEMYVPYLVRDHCYFGTGQLPKFRDDFFSVKGEHDLSLISTSEVPLTNSVREEILADEVMPVKLTAHTPCFRSEAGSYGKDTRGMIRQHQFEKVELVQITRPHESETAHEAMREHAENILKKLDLPYRTMILCTGDTGFSSTKTYDLEVWMPGQNTYREISSISNCRDFQARRMQARWRNPETGKPEWVHTLNGSGVAAGRALIAIMENYQTAEGNIRVPDVLQPYMQSDLIKGVK